jgi:hypothetical protein
MLGADTEVAELSSTVLFLEAGNLIAEMPIEYQGAFVFSVLDDSKASI